MQKLVSESGKSVYKTVILAFKRALELGTGSGKLVDAEPNTKLTSVAIREIEENKISYKKRNEK